MTKPNSEHLMNQTSFFRSSFLYPKAHLVLADGTTFAGYAFGRVRESVSVEVVFHTGMSGYQEILTDPSYFGQMICFTYPHIGNYGVNSEDHESSKIFATGLIVRDYVEDYSNFRAQKSLSAWLYAKGVMGLSGIDTRKLTRHIREYGAMPAAFGTAPTSDLHNLAKIAMPTDGVDLVAHVSRLQEQTLGRGVRHIVAFDFGIKNSITNQLKNFGRVTVVPASTNAKSVLKLRPDGIFLSNGPGDPAAVEYAVATIEALLGKVPIFGICLGHQLLCRALGATTYKLEFGHHGANHPVKDLRTGKIEITSQNHNYAVDPKSLDKKAVVTHTNCNDGVVEGISVEKLKAFSVQYHPEAGPGPHDSYYLFERFSDMMEQHAKA